MGDSVPVVVVTGGGAGIGLAVVRWHLARGWRVVAIERDVASAAALAGEPGVEVVTGDVANQEVLDAAASTARSFGTIAAWVNNAATIEGRPLELVNDEHVDRMLATNIAAVVRGTRLAVMEFDATRTRGAIVSVSSVHARLAFAGHALYDASKGAVEAMTRAIAAEVGPRGIRVNAVAPGAVMTEREAAARRAAPPVVEPIPLAMFNTPEEIAEVVGFLTSHTSSAINGAVVAADRGLSGTFLDEHWHSAKSSHYA